MGLFAFLTGTIRALNRRFGSRRAALVIVAVVAGVIALFQWFGTSAILPLAVTLAAASMWVMWPYFGVRKHAKPTAPPSE